MSVVDLVALPIATRMLVCLAEKVALLEKPPKYVGLRPGDRVAFLLSLRSDECCEGLAWVRVAGIFPSETSFPNQEQVPSKCGVRQWAVELELGIVGCAPTPGAKNIPSTDKWNEVTERALAEFAVMDKAICCFLDGFRGTNLVGRWSPLSIEGGCVGGTMGITVAAAACNCREDESPS